MLRDPQLDVPPSKVTLDSKPWETRANALVTRFENAARVCDEQFYNQTMAELGRLQEEAEEKESLTGESEPSIFEILTGAARQVTDAMRLRILIMEYANKKIILFARCKEPRIALGPNVTFDASGTVPVLRLPERGFLGANIGGQDRIPLFSPDGKATGSGFSASAAIDTSTILPALRLGAFDATMPKSTFVRVGMSYSRSSFDQSIGTISPGAGNRLLIPGPTGGASGFSIGGFPANIVENAQYRYDSSTFATRVDFGQICDYGRGFSLGGYGGLGYHHAGFDERFDGSIPGLSGGFGYRTSVDINSFDIAFGLFFQQVLTPRWAMPLVFGGFLQGGLNSYHASGTDTLSFTGVADSSIGLSKTGTGLGFATGLKLSANIAPGAALSLSATYKSSADNPVISRDGVNPSMLDMKRADEFRVGATLSYKYAIVGQSRGAAFFLNNNSGTGSVPQLIH